MGDVRMGEFCLPKIQTYVRNILHATIVAVNVFESAVFILAKC